MEGMLPSRPRTATRWIALASVVAVAFVAPALPLGAVGRHRSASMPSTGPLYVTARQISALETPANLGHGARIILYGDSVAASLGWGLVPEAARRGASVETAVQPGCSGLRGVVVGEQGQTIPWAAGCERFAVSGWQPDIAAKPADAILWMSGWDIGYRMVDGTFVQPTTPEGRQKIAELYREAADVMAPPGSGRRIVFVLWTPPAPSYKLPDLPANADEQAAQQRAVLHLVVQSDPARFSILSLFPYLCPAGPPCPTYPVPDVAPRPADGGHFSEQGSAWIAPKILDALGVT
jgi:hypothetical protein